MMRVGSLYGPGVGRFTCCASGSRQRDAAQAVPAGRLRFNLFLSCWVRERVVRQTRSFASLCRAVTRPHDRTRLYAPTLRPSAQMWNSPDQLAPVAHQMPADVMEARTAPHAVSFTAVLLGVDGEDRGVHLDMIQQGCPVESPAIAVEPGEIASLLGQAAARREQQEERE